MFKFFPVKLPIGGGTSLGGALDFLMDDLGNSINKTTLEQKGDWKPIVFLFTDGNPTDKTESSFNRWNQNFRNKTNLVAVSLGDNTDVSILTKITENVLILKNTDTESFKKFFKWVTASIKTSSISVSDTNDDGLHLASISDKVLSKIDLTKNPNSKIDEKTIVILAKCQTTKRLYLIKYQKEFNNSQDYEVESNTLKYRLVGEYPINTDYFELTDEEQTKNSINTSELNDFPSCPCCKNQYGLSQCSCGKIICVGENLIAKCPWCGIESNFGVTDESLNIGRTRG